MNGVRIGLFSIVCCAAFFIWREVWHIMDLYFKQDQQKQHGLLAFLVSGGNHGEGVILPFLVFGKLSSKLPSDEQKGLLKRRRILVAALLILAISTGIMFVTL